MAKAPQRANGTSHQQAEVGTGSELTAYDELARSRNGKQLCRFVDCYVTDSASATAAVRAAGYKTQHPSQKAWELMRRPLVAAAVAQKMREGEDRTKITQDRVLHKLAIVAFASLDDYEIDPATRKVRVAPGVPEDAMRAIKSIKYTVTVNEDGNETLLPDIRLLDTMKAVQLLMKYLGMLDPRLRVETEVRPRQTWKIGDKVIEF